MAKKKKGWLMMPIVHSKFCDEDLEKVLIEKSDEFLTTDQKEAPSFIFLSGKLLSRYAY